MMLRSRAPLPRDHRLLFFQGFLKRPREVGSIIPSSRFLERRIVRCAGVARAKLIVELGPGTGGTTHALLRAMRPDARLVAIEVNTRFAALLCRRFSDPRLSVYEGCASKISEALAHYGLGPAEVVLSGVPFSTMQRDEGKAILRAACDALAPGGRFVAYQVRDRVESLGAGVFGPGSVQTELLNVPPMRVYRWEKPASPLQAGTPQAACLP